MSERAQKCDKYALEMFIALKIVISCCFVVRRNLDFRDFLQKNFFNINYWSFSGFPGSFGKPNLNYSQPVLSNFCLAERRRLHRLKIPCSREPEKEVKVYQKGFSLAAIEHYGQHSIEYWYNSRVNNNIPHNARPTPAWNPN